MSDYIDREAFVEEQRRVYCAGCDRRKGMKNGKVRIVYDIGDAPCRACGIGDLIESIEDAPAADVVPVRRGKWVQVMGKYDWMVKCSRCNGVPLETSNFCPNCGALMKDGDGE